MTNQLSLPFDANALVALGTGIDAGRRLRRLLNDELDSLKVSDLDTFEQLQAQKESQLSALAGVMALFKRRFEAGGDTRADASASGAHAAWNDLLDILAECRELQRRNELLIQARMETIRGALNALQGEHGQAEAGTYDKHGRMKRVRKDLGWDEA